MRRRIAWLAAPAGLWLATLGGGFTFESRGQHELKGFDDTFELFRLFEKD